MARSRNFGTWALVALALGGVAAVVATSRHVTTSEKEARPNNILAAWRDDDVTRLEIEKPGLHVVVERGPKDDAGERSWLIKQPIDEEADDTSTQGVMDTLQFATFVRRIAPGEVDRAAFGLEAPRQTITLTMGAMKFRVLVGKESATPPGSAYAEVTGDGIPRPGVGIVSRELLSELDVTLDAFRDRDLVPYLSSALSRVVIDGAGGLRKLRRLDVGLWRFDGMLGDRRAARDHFDALTVQLARTTADRFIPLAEAEKALAGAEVVKLELVPTDPKRPKARLELGGQCASSPDDAVAIRREPDPVAACVPKSVLVGLTSGAETLDDRALFTLRKDEVESFVVTDGERRLELARKEAGFVMRAPQAAEVDGDAGNARIVAIVASKGTLVENPDLAALGLQPPRGSITLRVTTEDESKAREESVALSAPQKDGTVYAQREHDGAVLSLGREAARPLAADASLVRSRRIFELKPPEFRELAIDGGGVAQKLVKSETGAYSLEAPKGHRYDAGLASDVVDALGTLVAERWVSDRDDGSFGLGKPARSVRLGWASGDAGTRAQTLLLGADTDGGTFATLVGDPGVFVVPKRVATLLATLLLDRGATLVNPEDYGAVHVEAGEKTADLVLDAGHFVEKPGASRLGVDRSRRIGEAIATLRAEAALHLGPALPSEGLGKPILVLRAEPLDARKKDVKPAVIRFGAGDSWRGVAVHYARRDGVEATYVVARSRVQDILDAL